METSKRAVMVCREQPQQCVGYNGAIEKSRRGRGMGRRGRRRSLGLLAPSRLLRPFAAIEISRRNGVQT
jgi:hypothetical protein